MCVFLLSPLTNQTNPPPTTMDDTSVASSMKRKKGKKSFSVRAQTVEEVFGEVRDAVGFLSRCCVGLWGGCGVIWGGCGVVVNGRGGEAEPSEVWTCVVVLLLCVVVSGARWLCRWCL